MARPKRLSAGLPTRVYKKGRKFWYVTRENRWVPLGTTLAEMYRTLAELHEPAKLTMARVFLDWRAAPDGLQRLSAVTQRNWLGMLPRLEAFFGDAEPGQLRPHHVREFMDYDRHGGVGRLGAVSANRHVGVLSSVLSWAIQRGYLDSNPCREVRRNPEAPRTHLPTEEEYRQARARASEELAVLMDFALVSGARRTDLLRLLASDVTPDGVLYTPQKTRRRDPRPRLVARTPDVDAILARALALNRGLPHLFVPPQARQWTYANFNAAWQRLKPGFHFHDIRAMAASSLGDIAAAKVLLSHTGETTTAIYRRGVVVVQPAKLVW